MAGYRTWETKFTRYVKKGEKGIKILAPAPYITTKEMDKLDPVTRRPVLDEHGVAVKEQVEIRLARFKVISIFDLSQTDGKPLPELAETLTGDVKNYALFMDALRAVSPLPIVIEPMPEHMDGFCRYGEKIALRAGMSEIQTILAAIHEITHAKLHDYERARLLDETAKPKDKNTEELEAESVAFCVCQHFSLETGANSFGYLATWSKDRDAKELRASLDTIRKTAAELIDNIDERFQALSKERGVEPEPVPVESVPVAKTTEQINYEKFEALFPKVVSGEYRYLRLEAYGMEPLAVEWIGYNTISLMHTYELNGDLCYDPDIVVQLDPEAKTLTSVSYEQSLPPMYQEVYDGDGVANVKLQNDINTFLEAWMGNISEQGYLPVRGHMVISGEDINVSFDAAGNPILPEPVAPEAPPAPDLSLPDPAISAAERDAYGYTQDDMRPLSMERAAELFDAGHNIYLLYPDNTEMIAFDRDDIISHGGLCGIPAADWALSPDRAAQNAVAVNAESNREADLIYGGESKFGIYQIRDDIVEARDFRFAPMRELEAYGLSVDRANYELVYTGKLDICDTQSNLHKICADFQGDSPELPSDYHSRSVSVSDVIVLQWRGNVSSYFVDSTGFKALPAFTGDETPPEPAHEQQTTSQIGNMAAVQPAVQRVARKQPMSITDRLNFYKEQAAQEQVTPQTQSKDREVTK